ncbi:MAG: tRNA 4-thiouridine(8) synthase ThiI [Lentisphaerae bacterium]|nr:tRNA 4-thiouridine(8) synthase ThiI [Lentisphaerota bacterium]
MQITFGEREPVRALCLFSGGLDSMLAVCVLREQGIVVHGVFFESPFFDGRHARAGASALDLRLHALNFSKDIVALLNGPRFGFGSCMNPCLDCHALMLRRAGELMDDGGYAFLATGEVLNERPMSQTRQGLRTVARASGYAERVVRPLSAALLPETEPERLGLVDRGRLLDVQGRGRKRQLQLAARYGLKSFPSPAGGCLLTEPGFCRRLSDLKEHEGLDGLHAIELLRIGRHFRLADRVKLIVGRDEAENAAIEGRSELYDLVLKPVSTPGPTALLPMTAGDEQVRLAAAICARYSDGANNAAIAIRVRSARGARQIEALPASDESLSAIRI